jgi:hypothetical protein
MNRMFGGVLSFRLWRAMWGRVPDHPLMTIVKQPPASSDTGCSPILISMLLLMLLPALWVVGFGFALLAVTIGGTLRGAAAAALTARGVRQERTIGRLDLLGIAPGGTLGAGWIIAMREFRLSRSGLFANRYIHNAQRIIGIGGLVMVLLITFGTLLFQFEGVADFGGSGVITPAVEYMLGAMQLVAVTGLWLLTDNAQGPLIGVMIGIRSGLSGRRAAEAAGAAAAQYGALQVVLLAAAVFLWAAADHMLDGPRLGLTLTAIVAVREIVLHVLWRSLQFHLNATGAELAVVLRF